MASEAQTIKQPQIRRPRQKRSLERFEAILDAAERTLIDHDPAEISIYSIASEAGMSPASIYHFFPDSQHIFAALAERYFEDFISGSVDEVDGSVCSTWQDWIEARYLAARKYFNRNHVARKVLLGAASSSTIQAREHELNAQLARTGLSAMNRLFVVPAISDLADRLAETLVMNDALWTLAIHRHGSITDEADEYAKRARLAHMRTYLPEFLPKRSPAEAPAARG